MPFVPSADRVSFPVNGSAARRAAPGDILIIATFAVYNEVELAKHEPDLIYVDRRNRIVRSRP